MLFRLLSYSAIAAGLASSAYAAGADQFYFKGAVGYGINKGKTQEYENGKKVKAQEADKGVRAKGVILEAALGYHVSDEFRAELGLIHSLKHKVVAVQKNATAEEKKEAKKNAPSHSFTALMVNGYYDFNNTSDFTPYIGVGVGYAINQHSKKNSGTDAEAKHTTIKAANTIALSAAAGIAYKINDNMVAELGYKMLYVPYNMTGKISAHKDENGLDVDASTMKMKFSAINHTVNLGLRVSF